MATDTYAVHYTDEEARHRPEDSTLRRQAAKILRRSGPTLTGDILLALHREPRWRSLKISDLDSALRGAPLWFTRIGERWSLTAAAVPADERVIEAAAWEILRTRGPLRASELARSLANFGFSKGYISLTLSQSTLLARLDDGTYCGVGQASSRPSQQIGRADALSVHARQVAPAGAGVPAAEPSSLRRGDVLTTRREISKRFGGTPFRGISYKTGGDWVIVISSEHGRWYGYKDGWVDDDDDEARFLYSGEWRGCGDMSMTGGNAAVRDRSGRIFLFVKDAGLYRFRGRFSVEEVRRQGMTCPHCARTHAGIRFLLKRLC